MEKQFNQKESESNEETNEQTQAKPNTENGDLEYTPDEVEYADGHGTLLDEEIDDQTTENDE